MAEYEMNLRDYQRVLRKRYRIILIFVLLGLGVAFAIVKNEIPIYETKASVSIEQMGAAGALLGQSSYGFLDKVTTQAMVITSFLILKDVVERLEVPEIDVEWLQEHVTAQQIGLTNMIEIVATVPKDPDLAMKVANETMDAYDAYSDSVRRGTVERSIAFIRTQLDSCDTRLRVAEDSLKWFQSYYQIPTMDAKTNYVLTLLAGVESDIRRIEEEIVQNRSQVANLEDNKGSIDYSLLPVGRGGSSEASSADTGRGDPYAGATSPLVGQLMTLRLQRTDLLRIYTKAHPEVIALDEKTKKIQESIKMELRDRLTIRQSQLDQLYAQRDSLKAEIGQIPGLQLQYRRFLRDVDANAALHKTLQDEYYQALIKREDTADEVLVISRAERPTKPINRKTGEKMLAGIAIGLILGVVAAFVKESLDTSLGTMEDMEEYIGVPVLAMIPHIDMKEQVTKALAVNPALADYPNPERQAQLVTQLDSKAGVAESYRILRTHLQYASVDRVCKVIMMTSSRSGEGKTITVCNLAIVLAQATKRTLLVECDLRRPAIYSAFGIEREPGVIGIVLGEIDWHDCIKGVTDMMMGRLGMEGVMVQPGLDHLHVVTCGGPAPPQPTEMLATERMRQFVEEAREEYDFVLLDVPPVLPVTDATVLSGLADGILLVYQAGQRRADLKLAKIRLDGMVSKIRASSEKSESAGPAKSKTIGVILNDVRAETVGYSIAPSHYYYYYAESQEEGRFAQLMDYAKEMARGALTGIRNMVHH